jgi:hypothetical protein
MHPMVAIYYARAARPLPVCHLIMDRAYEGDETRDLGTKLNYLVVVPSTTNIIPHWRQK